MLSYINSFYSIHFYSRSLLYLSKNYPNIKSSIKTTIKFDADEKYQKGIQYKGNKIMSLLTNEDTNENLIEIQIDNIHKQKFNFNLTDYDFNTDIELNKKFPQPITVNNLLLSSNDGNNMYHGYLYKLELEDKDNKKYIYGVKNYISQDTTTYIPIMLVSKDTDIYSLYAKKDDDKLYRFTSTFINNKSVYEYKEFILENNSYDYFSIELFARQTTVYDENSPHFYKVNKDDRYQPSLVKTINGKFAIRFFRKSLLKLNSPIANINKITAIINIESSNCKKGKGTESYECKFANDMDNIEDYMDLLASKRSSVIKLNFITPDKYDGLEYKINNLDKPDDKNRDKKNELIHNGNIKTTINIDINDPSLIECLGVVHDIRSNNEITYDPVFKGNKNVRDSYIKKHSFIGHLYDLTIYKNN